MNVNGITAAAYAPTAKTTGKTSGTSQKSSSAPAAVYEKSSEITENTTAKSDTAVVESLKAEAEKRTAQLRSLVEKMMLSQGKAFDSDAMWNFLRSGEYTVDEATSNQAKADIAEDGYWGVEQTSDRLVSFAKALAGSDPAKAESMINAVKTGYEQATKAWGGELPEICKKTLDATLKKLDEWKTSSTESAK
ncbi:hypothetical protein R2R35_12790 [Anaerocolumna sp. AGMB13020]|uniref:hypothetical protein n=1 Tax=Anaerocolumna sp. AGMB13020 TaxID=3081750 RepID=UPI002952974F|nr:hypothetical protein [Anaerocolumna sp. AGMB13020]WOO34677.1 hypothetical protein R2R35_12790 [Anaerocolumna sp. AGMB13020]